MSWQTFPVLNTPHSVPTPGFYGLSSSHSSHPTSTPPPFPCSSSPANWHFFPFSSPSRALFEALFLTNLHLPSGRQKCPVYSPYCPMYRLHGNTSNQWGWFHDLPVDVPASLLDGKLWRWRSGSYLTWYQWPSTSPITSNMQPIFLKELIQHSIQLSYALKTMIHTEGNSRRWLDKISSLWSPESWEGIRISSMTEKMMGF